MAAGAATKTLNLEPQAASRETRLGTTRGLSVSEPLPSGAPYPARPHLLSLSKRCHQLGTKCSSARNYGELRLTQTTRFLSPQEFSVIRGHSTRLISLSFPISSPKSHFRTVDHKEIKGAPRLSVFSILGL